MLKGGMDYSPPFTAEEFGMREKSNSRISS
jgi:hypothetical protein